MKSKYRWHPITFGKASHPVGSAEHPQGGDNWDALREYQTSRWTEANFEEIAYRDLMRNHPEEEGDDNSA